MKDFINGYFGIFAVSFLCMAVVDANVLKGRAKWDTTLGIEYDFGTACISQGTSSCVNEGYNENEKALITSILNKIAKYTNNCIRFSQSNLQIARLRFIPNNGCSGSYIGRNTNQYQPQIINLAKPNCLNEQAISFVLMQTLGFLREQQRPDRDNFVQVFSQNIQSFATGYFQKFNSTQADTLGLPYDYFSITHASTKSFSKNGNQTIKSKISLVDSQFIGGKFMTLLDIVKLRKYYGCTTINNTIQVALKSYGANYRYVYANPKLIVNGNQSVSQTRFLVYFNSDSTVSLKSVPNDKFVSVDNSSFTLTAVKAVIGDTEKFYMNSYSNNFIFFRSKSSTKYVSIYNVNNTFVLVANKSVASSDCLFQTEIYW